MIHPMAATAAERAAAHRLFRAAFEEDLGGSGDITSRACVPAGQGARLAVVSREAGRLAGLAFVPTLLRAFAVEQSCRLIVHAADGEPITAGQCVAELTGPAATLLTIERTLLNTLARLSGIATLTAAYVAAVSHTRAAIYDTRKTTPGWRLLEKYAVRAGGGKNHRLGLYDAVLLKDNHRLLWQRGGRSGSLAELVRLVRSRVPEGTFVEIEVDTLQELHDALAGEPDAVLLDNMSPALLREAVAVRDRVAPRVVLEASGGITLKTVGAVAETGVDRISVGALTHSFHWLDFTAELTPAP